MGKVLHTAGLSVSGVAASNIRYIAPGVTWQDLATLNSARTDAERTAQTAGTARKARIWLSVNTLNNTSTYESYINGGVGGISLSIASSTTGEFTDTDSESIAVGDEYCFRFNENVPSGGTATLTVANYEFEASSNTTCQHALTSVSFLAAASVTYYYTLAGRWQGANTTRAYGQIQIGTAGTVKNLYVDVNLNTRSTNTVLGVDVNASASASIVTVAGGATGVSEDTSNTASVSVGDNLNYYITSSTGTGNFGVPIWSIEIESTNKKSLTMWGNASSGSGISQNTTRNLSIGGAGAWNATENLTQAKITFPANCSYLNCYVNGNTTNNDTTLFLRVNTANSGSVVIVDLATTGQFVDTSTTAVVDGDVLNFQASVPAGSGTATFRNIALTIEDTTVVASNIYDIMRCGGVVPFPR